MRSRSSLGQSLFEVVVAIGVAALILVGAMSLSTISVRNSNFARNDSVATKFAQEGIEWIREERDKSWDTFRSNNSTPKNLGNLSWSSGSCTISGTTFCRRITAFRCEFYDPGPPVSGPNSIACSNTRANIAYVTVSVSWQDTQGTHSVKTDTIFTRWR